MFQIIMIVALICAPFQHLNTRGKCVKDAYAPTAISYPCPRLYHLNKKGMCVRTKERNEPVATEPVIIRHTIGPCRQPGCHSGCH